MTDWSEAVSMEFVLGGWMSLDAGALGRGRRV